MRFLGPMCLCKGREWVDVTTVALQFRLHLCLTCLAYRILERE